MSRGLEQRYRRVLRLLPGYYRDAWEEDMVAAFLDSWLTGDRETDEQVLAFCRPGWSEVASVVGLAVRLYLGGSGTPRRYFAWGQAVRGAVLAALLIHAAAGLSGIVSVFLPASYQSIPRPPAAIVAGPAGDIWSPTVWYLIGCAWIVIFVALILGYYRTARVLALLAVVPSLVWLLKWQLAGGLVSPFGSWSFWFLIDLAPVLAMAAFHRDAPPPARRSWLLALPVYYLLVSLPLLAAAANGHTDWVPDTPGVLCILISALCLVHAWRAWAVRTGSGVWSLTLVLLAAVSGVYRVISLGDNLPGHFLNDPHLIAVGLTELLILAVAAALVVPDAARAQTAVPAPPSRARPQLG